MNGGMVQLRDINQDAQLTKGLVVVDAKNLYDKIHRATATIRGPEKRSDLEALGLRQNLERCNTPLRWVDGSGMLSNFLTKVHEKGQGWLYLSLDFRWKITYDEAMRSQRRRKAAGLSPLEDAHDIQNNVRAQEGEG